jgi:hypothetical protein
MTSQTKAVQNILDNITRAMEAHCVSCPDVMIECILSEAQELIDNKGYCYDVAMAIACKMYPATKYAATLAYEN